MKKPARRNAEKALCAYFTSGHRTWRQVGVTQGKRPWIYIEPALSLQMNRLQAIVEEELLMAVECAVQDQIEYFPKLMSGDRIAW